MAVQNISPKIEKNEHLRLVKPTSHNTGAYNPSFGGTAEALYAVPAVFLRFLDTNQAWGANLVDVGSMVIQEPHMTCHIEGLIPDWKLQEEKLPAHLTIQWSVYMVLHLGLCLLVELTEHTG